MKALHSPYLVKFSDGYAVINPKTGMPLATADNRDDAVDALVAAVQKWIDNGHKPTAGV